jgi:hypothetical protein
MKTQLAIFLALVGGALAQQSQVSTSTTWCVTRPVVVVDGNYEFYGADCITLMRCPTNSIVLAGYDSTPQPKLYPDGIESPVLVLQTADGKGVGVIADGLDLVTYVDHASPRPDAATIAARVAAAKAERQALRDVLKDIRVETVTNIADCVTISASTTNTANAAQGVQIRKLADELADTNRQLNRLRRALLDYLRGTE